MWTSFIVFIGVYLHVLPMICFCFFGALRHVDLTQLPDLALKLYPMLEGEALTTRPQEVLRVLKCMYFSFCFIE